MVRESSTWCKEVLLTGVDCHMKQQNINAAIETLTRVSFNVSDPSLASGGQEPIDVEVN
jgi:hypothetical protein